MLFGGRLSDEVARAHGYSPAAKKTAPAKAPAPQRTTADGAVQMLAILQRDARLVDFLLEDISSYTDEQVGAAVRNMHDQCRESLDRYVRLAPVIDGVEGTFTRIDTAASYAKDPSALKLIGNVPADGKVSGGILRHKGWKAERMELPALPSSQNAAIVAPAELEVE